MSILSQLIHEQSKSLTEEDARRVLDFIKSLSATTPGPEDLAGIKRAHAAPATLDERASNSLSTPIPGTAAAALALLATARFSTGPVGSADEIEQRIEALRDGWDRD